MKNLRAGWAFLFVFVAACTLDTTTARIKARPSKNFPVTWAGDSGESTTSPRQREIAQVAKTPRTDTDRLESGASPEPSLAPKKCRKSTKDKLAVLEFHASTSLSRFETEAITDMVRAAARELLPDCDYLIMTRESILQLLPPGKNLAQCEGECEVETGRLIGADYIVSGEIGRFGKKIQVRMKLFETKTSNYLGGQNAMSPDVDGLPETIGRVARKLFTAIAER